MDEVVNFDVISPTLEIKNVLKISQYSSTNESIIVNKGKYINFNYKQIKYWATS